MKKKAKLTFSGPNELHLWLLPVPEVMPAVLREGYGLLSSDERARNQRYIFEKDRIRHLLTRVFIRQLLGAYLGEDPADLQFASNHYGRPTLVRPDGAGAFDFNLSHAGDLIACGVVPRGRIGIDIEPVERDVKISLASTFFAKKEIEELFSLPEDQRQKHFLRLWTLKEAYIKARGMGMAMALDSFAFYDFGESGFQFWDGNLATDRSGPWTFFSLQPILGCKVAGAWETGPAAKADLTIRARTFLPYSPEQTGELTVKVEHHLTWRS